MKKTGKSRYAHLAESNPLEDAQKVSDVEKIRDALFDAIMKDYRSELSGKALPENKTTAERDKRTAIMNSINDMAITLNARSMSEGAQVVGTAALNLILSLKDEINKLYAQNYILNKRLTALEDKDKPELQNE